MLGRRSSTALAMVAIAIVAATLAAAPGFQFTRGLSLDVATALRWRLFGDLHDSSSSPAVVVALDEETYRTPPFKGTPMITWTGEIARVLAAVLEGGAKAVGFDVIFPTTIEDSEMSFGNETIGERMRGFDRDFLRALASAASVGKIVLGEIRTGDDRILPAAGQRIAVGQMRNIRSLNVYSDADGVVRRVPLMLPVNGGLAPSMSLELASRALETRPKVTSAGVEIAGYTIASLIPNAMTLNFDGGSGDIPAYSLADLLACLGKGDTEFFRRNFGGRVVLFGSKLELEDLKMTSKRFASAPRPTTTERCVSAAASEAPPAHGLIDGVFVQATAVNNLVRREAVTELGDGSRWLLALTGAAMGSAAALTLTPAGAAVSFLFLCAAAGAGAAIALFGLVALPVVEFSLAGAVAIVGTTIFRLFVTDKDKRLLLRNLKETTAVKERFESELRVAHDIQMSFLKKIFPAFPDRSEFSLYATLVPAREVGGDLYDFGLLEGTQLFFYVGDVADKGVPASLGMAMTIVLMRRASQQPGITPAEILRQVNATLSEDNESSMFVTLFVGILNLQTGDLRFSNAGHNPPLILAANGECRFLALPDGLVLGVMAEAAYRDDTVRLEPGDMIVTYTDGVTEAMNRERVLYSEPRLQEKLATLAGREVNDTVSEIVASVRVHAAGAPQSDDITVLAVRRS